jgi:hypothetical protein
VLRWELGLSGKAVRIDISAGVWMLSTRTGLTAPKRNKFRNEFKNQPETYAPQGPEANSNEFHEFPQPGENFSNAKCARDDEDGELEEGDACHEIGRQVKRAGPNHSPIRRRVIYGESHLERLKCHRSKTESGNT